MKKLLALALVLMMVLSLAACGEKDPAPSGGENNTPSSQQNEQPSNTPGNNQPSGADMTDWDYADYADYTDGVPEPEFAYSISGVIGESFVFKGEASADEINAWKQTLLDNGAEEVREGDTWAVIDGAHLIEMNGITNGVARIYISLDDRPVSGGQPEQSDNPDNGGSETNGNETSNGEIEGIEWQENDLTKLVPKPENATVVQYEIWSEKYHTVLLAMTLDETYAYAQQLVAAGFEGDVEMLKGDSKMYYGENADGAKVNIMWNTETEVILNIELP